MIIYRNDHALKRAMSIKTKALGLSSMLVSEDEFGEIRNEIEKMKKVIEMLADENKRLKKRVRFVEKQASSAEELVIKLMVDFETLK